MTSTENRENITTLKSSTQQTKIEGEKKGIKCFLHVINMKKTLKHLKCFRNIYVHVTDLPTNKQTRASKRKMHGLNMK